MTGYTYRAIWEIGVAERPLSALKAEACAALDLMAANDGARITGDPVWTVADRRLVCDAPAVPLAHMEETAGARRARLEGDVLRLAGLRWSVRQIASTTGTPASTVQSILARYAAPKETRVA
ncbi:hypothetical protein ACLQ25_09630 [Micromonospora sp. DT44]|uniref:hypothetical protein n=1 Tax=Micromonospora sp. DT44 TaxID=3393439 RepID=UPI003CFA0B54